MKKIYGNERVIPYRPQLKQFFGSANAAVLYAQLEYWAATSKDDSFYKFNAPCDHELYRKGDSLQEELCFNRRELENALDRICKQYACKADYDTAEDKFDSMPYCSYVNKFEHTKHYFRNHDVCDYINISDSDDLPIYEDGRSTTSTLADVHIVHSGSVHNVHPILILYKRLQQKIAQDSDFCASIAKSDTDACTLQQEIPISHTNLENNIQSNARKNTKLTRGRGAGAEPSETGQNFAKWFSEQTPMKGKTPSVLRKWAETCDKLIEIGYTKKDISDMCLWALKDAFWAKNFLSATKLLSKNKEDVPYHEVFMLQVNQVRKEQEKSKPRYNGQSYNPTGAHL